MLDSEDVADTNHASIDVITSDARHKIPSLSSSAKAPPAFQFGSLEPAMVKVLLADKRTMNEENYIDKFEEDGKWILVTRRWRQRRCIDELHPLFLKKSYSPTVRKPNPMRVLKSPHVNFKKPSKSNHRTPVTLDDFFPKKFFESKCACDNSKTQSKMKRSNDCQVMEKCLIMPITKIDPLPRTESSPIRVSCKKLQGTFNPKAYKLLEKSGYDFSNPSGLGKLEPELTGEKIHGLKKAQYKLRKQGDHVYQPKTGLGFTPAEPVRIHVTKKEKCVTVQHISAGSDDKGKQPSDNLVFVFNRLGTLTTRSSAFKRLGVSSRPQSSVFNRLGAVNIQQQKKRNLDWKMDMMESKSNEKTLLLSQPQGNKSSLNLSPKLTVKIAATHYCASSVSQADIAYTAGKKQHEELRNREFETLNLRHTSSSYFEIPISTALSSENLSIRDISLRNRACAIVRCCNLDALPLPRRRRPCNFRRFGDGRHRCSLNPSKFGPISRARSRNTWLIQPSSPATRAAIAGEVIRTISAATSNRKPPTLTAAAATPRVSRSSVHNDPDLQRFLPWLQAPPFAATHDNYGC
ncbi:hypothetical protein BUALT_Bualt09G0008200 [Buddleja alternifolia]|uniref:G-patch domain-containing protein n=1 Tax=Buddleja alternifolia TaxID=168488 RepID=A0AAV6X9L7_9LAMI|nr:hypothetical protein BUALT_Bualt09G0008200 [Buddleja alternifolia]